MPNISEIGQVQFEAIAAAAELDGVLLETEPLEDGMAPSHAWQRDHVLARGDVDEKNNGGLRALGAKLAPNLDGSEQQVSPDRVKLLVLENTQGRATGEIVEDLNSRDDLKDKVFENNLLYVTHGDGANFCPADEPTPARSFPETIPYPRPRRGDAGRGVRITVIDTGLSPGWDQNHPWLTRRPRVHGDAEFNTYGPNGLLGPHAGHGTFIAGVIRCVAPRAEVRVSNVLKWSGAMLESEIARTILDELDRNPAPDIISLSAGCIPMHHEKYQRSIPPPQAMLDVMNRMNRPDCRTLLVAAAGNDGMSEDHARFYPALFAGDVRFDEFVVAVGALRQDREGRACFSNYGDWVTVYEEGEKLVNAFPEGTFVYQEPIGGTRPTTQNPKGEPPVCVYYQKSALYQGCSCVTAPVDGTTAQFRGMAVWSGTSFSTPLVAGRVARRMSRDPQFAGRPRAAMRSLRRDLVEIKDAADGERLPVFRKPVSR